MSTSHPTPAVTKAPPNSRVAVIAARFNAHIVDKLVDGCLQRLAELSVADVQLFRVPGAFELPVAAKWAADAKFDAVICLGCVVRGDTPHFDFVAGEAARGIQTVATTTAVPVIFGVLTTNTEQQSQDRAGGPHSHAGINAADAAVEMLILKIALQAADGRR